MYFILNGSTVVLYPDGDVRLFNELDGAKVFTNSWGLREARIYPWDAFTSVLSYDSESCPVWNDVVSGV